MGFFTNLTKMPSANGFLSSFAAWGVSPVHQKKIEQGIRIAPIVPYNQSSSRYFCRADNVGDFFSKVVRSNSDLVFVSATSQFNEQGSIHMKIFKKKNSGFSLVELMIVVAIIGILSALAVPRFQSFQAKAKATEGKTSLSQVFTLQQAYHGDNDTYGSLQNIGFSLNGTSASGHALAAGTRIRFSYSTTQAGPPVAAIAANAFTATASAAAGALGGCQTAAYTGTVTHENAWAGFASAVCP